MISRSLCNEDENFQFSKTLFFSITLTFIDDYVLNINDIKEFWSFGLCWPLLAFLAFLAFVTLDESFKQKVANLVKNKQNWPVCINQMLKPIPNEIGHFNALWMTGTKAGPLEKVDEFNWLILIDVA